MSKESPRNGITRIRHGAQWYNYRLYTQGVAMGDDEKRKGLSRSDIVLAFPVSDDDTPIIANQDVYAFLALRSYGFSVSAHPWARCAILTVFYHFLIFCV